MLKRTLLDAVAAASISDFIRIEVRDNLTVTGWDPDGVLVSTELRGDATAPAPTTITVPTKQLQAALKSMGDDITVEMSSASTSQLRLRSSRGRADVSASGRMPVLPTIAEWFPASASIADALGYVAVAASDMSRPSAAGVRLELNDTVGTLIACDAARLHLATFPCHDVVTPTSATLSPPVIKPLLEVLASPTITHKATKVKEGVTVSPTVRLAITPHYVAADVAYSSDMTPYVRRVVIGKRLPDPWVDWRRLHTSLCETVAECSGIVVNAPTLSQLLRGCPGDVVSLSVRDGGLVCSYVVMDDTRTRVLGTGELVGVRVGGEVVDGDLTKISVRYLLDALNSHDGDVVLTSGLSRPLRVVGAGAGEREAFVLFVR